MAIRRAAGRPNPECQRFPLVRILPPGENSNSMLHLSGLAGGGATSSTRVAWVSSSNHAPRPARSIACNFGTPVPLSAGPSTFSAISVQTQSIRLRVRSRSDRCEM
jgi:hypothetical protein